MYLIKHLKLGLKIRSKRDINLLNLARNFADAKRKNYDVVVVGGGIVGAASAREILLRHPNLKVAILEKENKLAMHQSGHNSGVVHAGIYYVPGSLKAKLCVEGLDLSYKYFDEKKIPYKKCGKLIVATTVQEIERLDNLFIRGNKNNVKDLKLIEGSDIQKYEPHCKGFKAIHSPHTGIVDWELVTQHYGEDFKNGGGDIHLNFEVKDFKTEPVNSFCYPVTIKSKNNEEVSAKYVLTCAGLYSDKIAQKTGCKSSPKIVPFRGEYLLLNQSKAHWIKGNIYPVPDPRFPFLGVHFTPRMDGSVWLGPNAVLALKREGYTWTDINLRELFETITYPGFIRMSFKFMIPGLLEMLRSGVTYLQVKKLKAFIPEISTADVKRGPAGVRAQALDYYGQLVDDFVFDSGDGEVTSRILHCRNAPSPGATSSLAIAKMVADKMEQQYNLTSLSP